MKVVTGDAGLERASKDRDAPLLRVADLVLPLVWLLFYLVLPVSEDAPVALASWFDQQRDLGALRSVLTEGRADAIDDNAIGPAYIAAAALVHFVARVSPEDSLVALTRLSYALSIAGGMVLVPLFVRRLALAPRSVSLAAQFVFLALAFATWTWSWSNIPWSHFFAALLGVAFYVVRIAPARLSMASAAVTGLVLALLGLTRTFEFIALLAAWGLGFGIMAVLRLRGGARRPSLANLLVGAGAFAATALIVCAATGKRDLFVLYSSTLGTLPGDISPAEVAETPPMALTLVPLKTVQVLLDPCFYTLCTLNDYRDGPTTVGELWRMPLALQLPTLAALPLCVLAVAVLLGLLARRRNAVQAASRELQVLVEMTIAASGLTLGYLASSWASSSALKYGFARDFLLAAILAGIVAVSLLFIGLWRLLAGDRPLRLGATGRRHAPELAVAAAALGGSIALILGMGAARDHGLPRLGGRHLDGIRYTAECRALSCDTEIRAVGPSGRPVSIPSASALTFGCGSDSPRFTLYAPELPEAVRITQACRAPRLVAAWPVVMGAPPTRSELHSVEVVNVVADGRD